MTEKAKIYSLNDPNTNEVRYIGMTTKELSRRLKEHISESKNKRQKHHRAHWIKSLLSNNKFPIIDLIEEVEINKWQESEIYWIAQFKEWGFNLTNSSIGGDGNIGYKKTKEEIEKHRKDMLGKIPWNKGLKNCFSTEWKLEQSKKGKARKYKVSEEHKEKLKKVFIGIPKSEEHKNKVKESITKLQGIKLELLNLETNEILNFDSIVQCADYFNVYQNTIRTGMNRKDSIWRNKFKITRKI